MRVSTRRTWRIGSFLALAVLVALGVIVSRAGVAAQQRPRPDASRPAAPADRPKFKAIFEPVNYPKDLELTDVHFVSDEVGWAAGKAGTILHTTTGGKEWAPQLGGDPEGAERPIGHLRFVSERVGFAVQVSGSGDHVLLRTTDGETWTAAGTVGQHRGDYAFTSPENGVYLAGPDIFRTTTAGREWTKAYSCRLSLQVDGLTRDVSCHFESVDFPTPTVGYAASRVIGRQAFAMAKTEDGGATWNVWPVTQPAGAEYVVFLDENTGFIRMWGGKVFMTTDGGRAWTGVPGLSLRGGKAAAIKFANAQVGWAIAGRDPLHYTVDGGKRWSSRAIKFPAPVAAFSLPSPDRGYVVGPHGMVYRYRIVPVEYTAPGMLDAPAMATRR